MAESPYNANPELVAMKDDIANREYRLKVKKIVITGAVMLAGAAAGALLGMAGAGLLIGKDVASMNGMIAELGSGAGGLSYSGALLSGAPFIGYAGLLAAPFGGIIAALPGMAIADLLTEKERTKLQIDKEMVQSYMQGKNYWGKGYREEVAERGYDGPQLPSVAAPLPSRQNRSPVR